MLYQYRANFAFKEIATSGLVASTLGVYCIAPKELSGGRVYYEAHCQSREISTHEMHSHR